MTSPTVSIITPTFNRADLLPRVWRSLSEQSVPVEWIVIDDGSTDSTPLVMESFGDPRIVFLRLDHNQGSNIARNAGVRVSRGRYIIFLDSDDELAPHALKEAVQLLETAPPNIGAVLMIAQPTFAGKNRVVLPDRSVLNEEDLVINNRLQGDRAVIYRRNVFCNQMLPEEYRESQFVFVLGIARWSNYLVVNRPLTLVYRQNDNLSQPRSIIERSRAIAQGWETVIQNHAAILCQNEPARLRLYIRVLYRYAVSGDRGAMWHAFNELRAHHPGYMAATRAIAIIFAGTVGRCGADYVRLKLIRLKEKGFWHPRPN
jgi:glycosyltransferase involved in cell wall biosynthesis